MRLPIQDLLEAHAATLRAEALALPDAAFVPLPDARRHTRGRWEVCLLQLERFTDDFPDAVLADNRARSPRTWALLAQVPELVIAGVMRLTPGSTVLPHTDVRDDDVLRAHLALQLPEAERARWPEGTTRLMDIRSLHAARNPGPRSRLLLTVDVRLPEPVPAGVVPPWNSPEELAGYP